MSAHLSPARVALILAYAQAPQSVPVTVLASPAVAPVELAQAA